jgi:hypothetical protein
MDNEKGNRYALAALKKQRALLAGEIHAAKQSLKWKQSQLEHVDCTLRLLDPTLDPKGLPISKPRKRIKLFRQGELGRLIVDTLRRAGKPLGTHAIASALLEAGGYGEASRHSLTPRVRGNLAYLEKTGKVVRQGKSSAALWAIKSYCERPMAY